MQWNATAMATVLLAALLAGCAGSGKLPAPSATTTPTSATQFEVRCLVQDESGKPLAGLCHYDFPGTVSVAATNATGAASLRVGKGLNGTLAASAPGHAGAQVALLVDGPKSVRFSLAVQTVPDGGSTNLSQPVSLRRWLAPVTVVDGGSGAEPALAIAPDGTVYYSPLSSIYRSTNGGASFESITPRLPQAGPVLASDTSLSVAPDGTLWFSDDWPYAGNTQGCASKDKGTSWTCEAVALPGATDRMWIAGVSATEGYLQTGQALQQPNWLHSTTGSQAYTPYAAGTLGQYGNLVYDATHKAVYQVTGGTTQAIARVDNAVGTVSFKATTVPASYAIPWLAEHDGVLWTSGERGGKVVVGRSLDEGATWKTWTVSQAPASAAFSYVAAGPHGRAAVVYLGSDKAGPTNPNGGTWSLFVAETDDAMAAAPTWVESVVVPVVHKGNLCIGLNCEQSGGDTHARMEGDLIGIALDGQGNVHVAYVQDRDGSYPAVYLRQAPLSS